MTTTTQTALSHSDLSERNIGWAEFRIRDYASDLCNMVEAGEITDIEANQRLSDFQDRMARDGAWG